MLNRQDVPTAFFQAQEMTGVSLEQLIQKADEYCLLKKIPEENIEVFIALNNKRIIIPRR